MPSDRHALKASENPDATAPSPTGELCVKGGPKSKIFPHTKSGTKDNPDVHLLLQRGAAAQAISSGVLFPDGNPYRRD